MFGELCLSCFPLTIVTGSSPHFIVLPAIVFETSRSIENDFVNVLRVYALIKSCVGMEWVLSMSSVYMP